MVIYMEQYAQLSDSELEVMQIIWEQGGTALFAQITAALDERNKKWKTNTILSFLNRLIEKKMLKVKKQGRLNEYIALVSQDDFMAEKTRVFVDKMYRGNTKSLVSTLLKQNFFSDDDYKEIIDFWKEGKDVK